MKETTLRLSFTPDPDDAFAWWAIVTGRIKIQGIRFGCEPMHIQEANEACKRGELDVAAISTAAYPFCCEDYYYLATGASVGRGYGPALVSRVGEELVLQSDVVVVPGNLTTGALLLRLLCPAVKTVELPCDQVAAAIASGAYPAGVLIHEELLNWQHKGLRRVACLGAQWHESTGLPVPVGLIAVHRKHGIDVAQSIAQALRQSIQLAHASRAKALAWAMQYSHQQSDGIGEHFVDMFTNEDSLMLAPECQESLRRLYEAAYAQRLIPRMPSLQPVHPTQETALV